jgi:hypothetical protein
MSISFRRVAGWLKMWLKTSKSKIIIFMFIWQILQTNELMATECQVSVHSFIMQLKHRN